MVYLQATLLFATTLFTGLLFFAFPKRMAAYNQTILTFGGSFLFSLTLIDILPTVYHMAEGNPLIRYYLLLGFFFQYFLDLLSEGIAHGHVQKIHHKTSKNAFGLLSALFIHAMFDGFLVSGLKDSFVSVQMDAHHGHSHSLLSGVLLHKVPVTLSLLTILVQHKYTMRTIIVYLFIFALASPIACCLSSFIQTYPVAMKEPFIALWSLSVGNLFHIATTTLSEANSDHCFRLSSLSAHLAGAILAVMAISC